MNTFNELKVFKKPHELFPQIFLKFNLNQFFKLSSKLFKNRQWTDFCSDIRRQLYFKRVAKFWNELLSQFWWHSVNTRERLEWCVNQIKPNHSILHFKRETISTIPFSIVIFLKPFPWILSKKLFKTRQWTI